MELKGKRGGAKSEKHRCADACAGTPNLESQVFPNSGYAKGAYRITGCVATTTNGIMVNGVSQYAALIRVAGFSTLRLVEKEYPSRNSAQSHLSAVALSSVFVAAQE